LLLLPSRRTHPSRRPMRKPHFWFCCLFVVLGLGRDAQRPPLATPLSHSADMYPCNPYVMPPPSCVFLPGIPWRWCGARVGRVSSQHTPACAHAVVPPFDRGGAAVFAHDDRESICTLTRIMCAVCRCAPPVFLPHHVCASAPRPAPSSHTTQPTQPPVFTPQPFTCTQCTPSTHVESCLGVSWTPRPSTLVPHARLLCPRSVPHSGSCTHPKHSSTGQVTCPKRTGGVYLALVLVGRCRLHLAHSGVPSPSVVSGVPLRGHMFSLRILRVRVEPTPDLTFLLL
jgi:hypothetical protein